MPTRRQTLKALCAAAVAAVAPMPLTNLCSVRTAAPSDGGKLAGGLIDENLGCCCCGPSDPPPTFSVKFGDGPETTLYRQDDGSYASESEEFPIGWQYGDGAGTLTVA